MKANYTTLERIVVKEVEFPTFMTPEYLEQLLDTLPVIGQDDPQNPEWRETSVKELDLKPFGYNATVYVKDESDRRSNQTGTIKDRRAHENGPVLYRVNAENLFRRHLNGKLERARIPRLSEITAGNAGDSQARMNEKYSLPPPKLLLDILTPPERLEILKQLRADIYLAPLGYNIFTGRRGPYTPEQINRLTNNLNGHNVNSSRVIPIEQFYDWHVHEAFNFKPGMVFVPYGSGELFTNYLTWQRNTAFNGISNKDIRLDVNPADVTSIDILAAEPRKVMHSEADKLTGMKPFVHYSDNDIKGMRLFRFTGQDTGVYKVDEDYINLAYKILTEAGIEAEKSAAAGLGLYLQMFDQHKIDPRKKVLIINTGKGI